MAPEQIRAEPNLDARADIWSLGTILFELLTGRCPFQAETIALMYQKVLTEDPPSLLDFVPDAPHELNTIIRLCLQKDADDRFQTVQELVAALRGLSRPVVMPRPRLESGIVVIPSAQAPHSGVSLSVKLGLCATAAVLVAASVAFWQLQLRAAPPRAAHSQSLSSALHANAPAPPAPIASQVVPAPVVETALIAEPAPSIAPPAASVEKPEPPRRPAPAPNWPATRKPIPFSAGTRYGF